MKKILAVLSFCLAFGFRALAQDYAAAPNYIEPARKLHLGFGSGINNYLGLAGFSMEYQVAKPFTVYGGLGLGTWGTKVSFGGRYYGHYPKKWAFGFGYSQASGVPDVVINFPEGALVGTWGNVQVPVQLKSTGTLNLSAMRYWMLGANSKNRFNIELGYAIPLTTEPYELEGGYQLTPSGKNLMNIMQPGGIILGFGFSFGL